MYHTEIQIIHIGGSEVIFLNLKKQKYIIHEHCIVFVM